MKVFTLFDKAV